MQKLLHPDVNACFITHSCIAGDACASHQQPRKLLLLEYDDAAVMSLASRGVSIKALTC